MWSSAAQMPYSYDIRECPTTTLTIKTSSRNDKSSGTGIIVPINIIIIQSRAESAPDGWVADAEGPATLIIIALACPPPNYLVSGQLHSFCDHPIIAANPCWT